MYKRLAPRWDVLVAYTGDDHDDDEMSQSSSCFDWNVNIILLAAHHNPKIQTGLLTQSIKCAPAFLTSLKNSRSAILPRCIVVRLKTMMLMMMNPNKAHHHTNLHHYHQQHYRTVIFIWIYSQCKYVCYSSGFLLLSRHKNCL